MALTHITALTDGVGDRATMHTLNTGAHAEGRMGRCKGTGQEKYEKSLVMGTVMKSKWEDLIK